MSKELTTLDSMERIANAMVRSNMFGLKNVDQALALMATAVAEGRHPASVARDYHIIQGTPAKRSEAMMRDFQAAGGRVEWHQLDDEVAEATFSHPAGGRVKIRWDFDRAGKAGLASRDMWKKYPRQMLRSRCVSEGVRTVCPMATSGSYTPEEVQDIKTDEAPKVVDVSPEHELDETPVELTPELHDELCAAIENAADLTELKRAFDTAQSHAKRANDGTKRLMYAALKDERKDFLLLQGVEDAPLEAEGGAA